MKDLFDIFIESITSPFVTSGIGILSFISAVAAFFIACRAYKLQQKSDDDLNRVESNIDRMENSIKQIDKVLFEIERNRLASYLPKEDQEDIHKIFYEDKYTFQERNDNDSLGSFIVRFIREKNDLPKMNYPFSRTGDFPYFCVYVIETESGYKGKIQSGTYYYLSYDYKSKSWYMAERWPIEGSRMHKGFKVIFAGTSYGGKGLPLASEFCKNC